MLQLQRLNQSTLKDVTILAVSPDPPGKTRELLEKVKASRGVTLTHRFLSDTDLKTIDAYGIRNAEATRGMPHPTTILFDRNGSEVWRFIEKDYRKRPTDEELGKAVSLLARGKP